MARPENLSESQRNELLRRVDWRFLLRIDRLPATVSFAGGRLTRALELVSTSVVRPGEQTEQVDLAALVSPRARSLRAAYDALRPGGEVYAEWYLPALDATRARRRLEAAGFVNARCYLCWPWPQRSPKFWLPLDAPEAIASFLAARPRDGRRRSSLLRAAWRAAVRFRLMIPICAIAQKPDDEADPSEGLLRTDISWVLLTGGRRSINKVVGLGFIDSQRQPQLAVKFARNPSEDEPLEREAATLRLLGETAVDLNGVPEVLFVERRSGRVALGETAVAGRPLLHGLDHGSFATIASHVTSWLADLAGSGGAEVQQRAGWFERLVESPAREFEQKFASVLDAEETARGRQILARLTNLPIVCEHRDCSPWNVLHDHDGSLAVVDWESSEPAGLPGLDLVYFLTYAALFVERTMDTAGAAETYARTLEPRSTVGAVVRACEESYCARLGLDPDQLRPLRLLCWIVHSRSEYGQLEQDALGPPTRDALAGSLFLSLWRQELKRSRGRTAHDA